MIGSPIGWRATGGTEVARYAKIFNNFTGGEISPSVLGRTDLPQYQNGCEVLENFIPVPGGGAIRRPGTKLDFIQDKGIKLVPFVFNKDSSRYAYLTRNISTESLQVEIKEPNDFSENSSTTTLISSGGFSDDQSVAELQHAQYGNFLVLASGNHWPVICAKLDLSSTIDEEFYVYDYGSTSYFLNVRKITTAADYNKAFYKSIPFQDINSSDITITASATSGVITLTASDDIAWGDYLRIDSGGTSGLVEILSASSGTSASGNVLSTLTTTSATTDWYMSAWGDPSLYGGLGYPRTVAFYQGRLAFGGNFAFPDTIWFSESSNYDRLATVAFDHWSAGELQTGNAAAMSVQLASGEVNQIQWMLDAGKGDLAIGTSGAEWIAFAPDTASGFGPTNLKFERHSSIGSAFVQAVMAGESPVFVDRSGKRLRTLEFTEGSGKYLSNNLNELADHLVEKGYENRSERWDYNGSTDIEQVNSFVELQYDTTFQCIWVRSSFGDLYCCQYSRPRGIAAWGLQILGGTYDGTEAPRVRSVIVIPRKVTALQPFPSDIIMILVERQLTASVTKLCAEYIDAPFKRPNIDFERDDLTETGSLFSEIPNYLDMATYVDSGSSVSDTFLIGQGSDAWSITDDA